jgi:hypothetical protein
MTRISRTVDLAKASWNVLKQDRELLAFPVISFVVNAAVVAVFIGLIFLIGGFDSTTDAAGTTSTQVSPFVYVLSAFGYLACTFVTVFFNTAIVSGANERFSGGDPSLGSALGGAASRLPQIVPWALLTGTVGLVLQAIESRAGFLGRIVVSLIGAAWAIVTFLVVPILVVERLGPIQATKRSAQLFRQTWGENLAAQVGFGLVGFLAILPGLLVGGLAIASGSTAIIIGGVALAAVWVAAVLVVISALSCVFQLALYRYATGGEMPAEFSAEVMQDAFGPRRRRG